MLEELGGAQEALEDPQLEQVELPEARERDRRDRRAFESLEHCVSSARCSRFGAVARHARSISTSMAPSAGVSERIVEERCISGGSGRGTSCGRAVRTRRRSEQTGGHRDRRR